MMMERDIVEEGKRLFSEYYNGNRDRFLATADFYRTFVRSILWESGCRNISVSARAKDLGSCLEKLGNKYLKNLLAGESALELITDIIGVRVVCLYADEIERITDVLKSELNVLGTTDKIGEIEKQEAIFGYRAFHLDVKLNATREAMVEYRGYATQRAEIQVRTIVQDAWSVIDHNLQYKKNIPKEFRRRIRTLAALFELADREFISVRDEAREREKGATPTGANDQANEPTTANVFDLVRMVREKFSDATISGYRLDDLLGELRASSGDVTKDEINKVGTQIDRVRQYANWRKSEGSSVPGRTTMLRIAFWLADRKKFDRAIYDSIKQSFDAYSKVNEKAQ